MKHIIFILSLSICFAVGLPIVSSLAVIAPKAKTTIIGETITLADVFEGVSKSQAGYYLAPAPKLGDTMVLDINDLNRISQALDLGWRGTDSFQKTIIRRSSNIIDTHDIKLALKNTFEKKLKSNNFELSFFNKNIHLNTPYTLTKSIGIRNLKYDASKDVFQAVIFSVDYPKISKKIKGKIYRTVEIPVLLMAMRSGEIIERDDISYIKVRSLTVTKNIISNLSAMIGQTPKNTIRPMRPVYFNDIKPPRFIKRGDLVVINLNSKFMRLSTQGKAMSNGYKGDLIRVKNLKSKKIITAVVTGYKSTSVTPLGLYN